MDYDNMFPSSYNENDITLLVQGPEVIFVYWELSECHWKVIRNHGDVFLRLYRLIEEKAAGNTAEMMEQICLPPFASNWYFTSVGPDRSYYCEIGFKLADQDFLPVIRSNAVHTPALPVNDFRPAPRTEKINRTFNKLPPVVKNQPVTDTEGLLLPLQEIMSAMPFYMGIPG